MKAKMEWANYEGKGVFVKNISKEEYNEKYKNELTCIHGCEVRIKFTERKNGIKFFSTWNGEGNKHNENCEYHVKYNGKIGRKKLEARERQISIGDKQIINALDRKYKEFKEEYRGENKGKNSQGTKKVESLGKTTVSTFIDGGKEEEKRRVNITSIKAEFINSTYLNIHKCVIGEVDNVKINEKENEVYGYLNLKNDNYKVSVYFPDAFFKNEFGVTKEEFTLLTKALNKAIEKEIKLIVVCYGVIRYKKMKTNEFNINILSKKHVKINGTTLDKIINKGRELK